MVTEAGLSASCKWVITGGCGFVGTTLIHLLLQQNDSVAIRVVDNLSTGTREDLAAVTSFGEVPLEKIGKMKSDIELVVADITDPAAAAEVTQGADVIVHLAANTGVQPSIHDPMADMRTNVGGTLNYLEAARHNGVKTFIFASSGAPIGEADPPITEDSICRPISPYGASKLAGEAYCNVYHHSFGIDTIALRFSNVYGPRSGKKGSVVAKFIRGALNGESWVVNGSGEQTRDFIYSEDLARAITKAQSSGLGGEIFQIATGRETSIAELVDKLQPIMLDLASVRPTVEYGPPLVGDVARNFADNSRAVERLGWSPNVSLEVGLAKTVSRFVGNPNS